MPASRLKSQFAGSYPILKATTSARRLKSQPGGSYFSFEAQISPLKFISWPQDSKPSLTNSTGQKTLYVLRIIFPFRAAALLTITCNHQHTKQSNGYRWPPNAFGQLVSSYARWTHLNDILNFAHVTVNFDFLLSITPHKYAQNYFKYFLSQMTVLELVVPPTLYWPTRVKSI